MLPWHWQNLDAPVLYGRFDDKELIICILAREKEIRTSRILHLQVSLAAMSLHTVSSTCTQDWRTGCLGALKLHLDTVARERKPSVGLPRVSYERECLKCEFILAVM